MKSWNVLLYVGYKNFDGFHKQGHFASDIHVKIFQKHFQLKKKTCLDDGGTSKLIKERDTKV